MLLSVISLSICLAGGRSGSRVEISRDGGYSNIVIKFDSDVNQHYCAQYIRYLQVSVPYIILIIICEKYPS